MFTRDELLIIYNGIKNEEIKQKVHRLLYVDEELIETIKRNFQSFTLLKIEKSFTENTYYIHIIDTDQSDCCDVILNDLIKSQTTENNQLSIDLVLHDSLDDLWFYKFIDVYTNPIVVGKL